MIGLLVFELLKFHQTHFFSLSYVHCFAFIIVCSKLLVSSVLFYGIRAILSFLFFFRLSSRCLVGKDYKVRRNSLAMEVGTEGNGSSIGNYVEKLVGTNYKY